MHVVRDDGHRDSGGAALRAVLDSLPSVRWAATLGAVWPRATDKLYAFVATHRRYAGRLVSRTARLRADAALAHRQSV